MSHQKMTNSYKSSSELGLNSRQVMTRLLGTLIVNIEHAKNAQGARKYEIMMNYNRKSLRIIAFIRSAFQDRHIESKEEQVLQLAAQLRRVYQIVFIRLTNVLLHKNPQAEFDGFLFTLRDQYSQWAGKDQAMPIVENDAYSESHTSIPSPEIVARAKTAGYSMAVEKSSADFYA